MTTNILFLCPHGAAKSTASVAFLRRGAQQRGLDVSVTNAGTDPDAEVNPVVSARLEAEGLPPGITPRTVSTDDFVQADIIINIGCDVDRLPASTAINEWNVPNFSDDRAAAFASIEAHVAGLLAGLAFAIAPAD